MRLIDADELQPDAEWDEYYDGYTAYSEGQIKNAPTIAPVRHGHWDKANDGYFQISKCSACGKQYYLYPLNYNYCPHCGAKMDEVTK